MYASLHVGYKNVLRDMRALRQQIVYNSNGAIFSEKNGLVDRREHCWITFGHSVGFEQVSFQRKEWKVSCSRNLRPEL